MRELLDDRPDWFDDEHTGMTLLDYEEQAMDMALYDGFLIYPAIGLAGEAGEVANKVGKMLRDNEIPPDGGEPVFDMDFEQRIGLAKELGDVLWMLTAVSNDLGFDLEEIATMNLEKLRSRQRRGVCGGVAITDDTHCLRPRVEWLPR